MLLQKDDLAASVVILLSAPHPTPSIVLLGTDPGSTVTDIMQLEGYRIHVGPSQEVIADALALHPNYILIEPKVLEQLIRSAGNK